MPAIRSTRQQGYEHHHYVFQLAPPFSRKSGANYGPKFKPTRSIYVEGEKVNDCLKTLVQRRRVDGKSMLSVVRSIRRGFDTSRLNRDEEVRDKLLRLFDHENLVRIMDIEFEKVSGKTALALLGFEHMSRGTLNRILFDKVAIPESLCWHVLEGVTNALLWLHYGYQQSYKDGDWNPIALINIHPGAIYFTNPQGDETYGIAKVSSFDDAIVMPKGQAAHDAVRVKTQARDKIGNYVAPELLYVKASAALVSDIYSLGATLYHMMLGHPPEEVDLSHETRTDPEGRDFWVIELPQSTYSEQLKRIVREMLRTSRQRRPDGATLYQNLLEGMEVWRSESVEGRRYIRRIEEAEEEDEEGEEEEEEEEEEDQWVVKKRDKKKGKETEVKRVVEKEKRGFEKSYKVVEKENRGFEKSDKENGKEGEAEGVVGEEGNKRGKGALLEVIDLTEYEEGEEEDEEDEEDEEEQRRNGMGRGKGKTRGGGI